MVRKDKKIVEYTSKELFDWFAILYQAKFGRAYTSTTFYGLELKALKSLMDKYNTHEILCAIKTCISNNDRTVHIKYFVAGFDYYKPNTDRPDIYWYVGSESVVESRYKGNKISFEPWNRVHTCMQSNFSTSFNRAF